MDQSSRSLADASRFDGSFSGIGASSTPTKRSNPYAEDRPDVSKRRKCEQSVHQSPAGMKQYFPIASLVQTNSCPEIKGKVTQLSDWKKTQSKNNFLIFRLTDESGAISGLAFEPMSQSFHQNFQLGATVIIAGAKVEPSRAVYETATGAVRLIINSNCSVRIVTSQPLRKMIRDILDNRNERGIVNVLGIIEDVGKMARNFLREIKIVDESEANIILTLWDDVAKKFNAPPGSVIAANKVAVRSYKATNQLRTLEMSELLIDPPIDDTRRLKQWYRERKAASADSKNSNSSTLIQNTVQTTNSTGVNCKAGIVNILASTSTSTHQQHNISFKEVMEKPAGTLIDAMGQVVKVFDAREFKTKIGKRYGREFILRDEEGSEIEVRVMGDKVLENDILCSSFVKIKDASVCPDLVDTKKLLCGWDSMKINHVAPEVERGSRFSVERKERQQERSLISKTTATISPAAISRSENHFASSTAVEGHLASAGPKKPGSTSICSSKVSSTFASRVPDDTSHRSDPFLLVDFTPISELNERAVVGSEYNIIGLVVKLQPPEFRYTKFEKKPPWMRVMVLADKKGREIELGVWGSEVKDCDIPLNSVIAARNVTVRELHGSKTLSCLWAQIVINPDIPQAEGIRKLVPYNSASKEPENSAIAGSSGVSDNTLRRSDSSSLITFLTISEIKNNAVEGSKLNIAGLVIERKPAEKEQTKAGISTWMRIVTLADVEDEVQMVVSGNKVKEHDIPLYSVLTGTNVTIRELNGGRTLSCLWAQMRINPDIPQAVGLRKLIPYYSASKKTENSVIAGSSGVSDYSSRRNYSSSTINFSSFNEIKKTSTPGSKYNIVGIVIKRNPAEEQLTKAGRTTWMRTVILADFKDSEIEMTVWGKEVKDHDIPLYSIMTAKNVTARKFNGATTLTCLWAHLQVNPNIPQAASLKELIAYYLAIEETRGSVVLGQSTVFGNTLQGGGSSTLADFTRINKIKENVIEGSKHNIVGLVLEHGPVEERTTKAGKSSWMRTINVADEKDCEVEMAVWGTEVKDHDIPLYSVITARNVTVRVFMGVVTLNCLWAHLQINPDIPQAKRLKDLVTYYKATDKKPDSVAAGPSTVFNDPLQQSRSFAPVNLTSINEIKLKANVGSKHNIVGLVIRQEPVEERSTKAGTSSLMRIYLADGTDCQIEMTVWGNEVKDHDIPLYSVIIARNVTVQEFNGSRTLSCYWSKLQINPDIPQVTGLKELMRCYSATNEMQRSVVSRQSTVVNNSSEQGGSFAFVNFTSIDEIKQKAEAGSKYNIVGLVFKHEPAEERSTKSGKLSWMRTIYLADGKDCEIEMTVWGIEVRDHDIPLYSVITAKNVTVREFNGDKTLTCLWAQLQINPEIPQATGLKKLIGCYSATNETQGSVVAEQPRVCVNSSQQGGSSMFVNFTSIDEIKEKAVTGCKYNIVGLVIKHDPAEERPTKAGKLSWMRTIYLADAKDCEIEMTIWGIEVKDHDIPIYSVITAKNVTVREFDGDITLTCLWAKLQINPDIPQATGLKKLIACYVATDETQGSVVEQPRVFINSSEQGESSAFVHFTPIDEIKEKAETGSKYNVAGLVIKTEAPVERLTKSGKLNWTRTVILADSKDSQIEITIWGSEEVKEHDIPHHSVITARDVTVREYNGFINLNCFWSHFKINPNIAQVANLKKLIGVAVCHSSTKHSVASLPIGVTSIKEIKAIGEEVSTYNIAGAVVQLEPPRKVTTGAGNTIYVRDITIADEPRSQIVLSVWGDEVEKNDIPLHSVVTAREATVRLFVGEKSLSCFWKGLQINPDIPQAAELKKLAANYTLDTKIIDLPRTFHTIAHIKTKASKKTILNVIGMVCDVQPPEQVNMKDGLPSWLTHVILIDRDYNWIQVSVWFKELLDSVITEGSVLAATNAKVTTFHKKKKLNVFWDCVVMNPKVPAAARLKKLRTKETDTQCPNFHDDDSPCGDYTPFDVIERRKIGISLNTIGLVVEVGPLEKQIISYRMGYMKKCVLRDKNGTEIVLNIVSRLSKKFDIPMHSVIVVRNAIQQSCKEKEKIALVCSFVHVRFNVDIPETKGFKKAAINARVQLENPAAPDPNNFTAIKDIMKAELGTTFNILGIIVNMLKNTNLVNKPMNKEEDKNKYEDDDDEHEDEDEDDVGDYRVYSERVTLMDIDKQQITLIIRRTPLDDNPLQINSVIVARDATLRMFEREKVLWCLWDTVKIDPEISEDETIKFKNLQRFPIVTGYMPFKSIAQERWLIGCSMDIIGQVAEILPPSEMKFDHVKEPHGLYILRNDIMMKLVIFGVEELGWSEKSGSGVCVNDVIAAKGAMLQKSGEDIFLTIYSRNVEIRPKIPRDDIGAKCLQITQIATILEKAKPGDKLGVLALVIHPPTKINGHGMLSNIYENLDEEDIFDREPAKEFVKLIDFSNKKINMTMPISMADTLRKTGNNTVIFVRNVRVRVHEKDLELECSSPESAIVVNPKILGTRQLREWYNRVLEEGKENFGKVKDELTITPISEILENFPHMATASIMGILIKSDVRLVKNARIQIKSRRIQVVDESEKVIDILLWNTAATKFEVPLYSTILLRNFRVYAEHNMKWGAYKEKADFIVDPSDEENRQNTLRLETWFTCFWPGHSKPSKTCAAGSTVVAKKKKLVSNEKKKLVENPTNLAYDIEMMETPISLWNDDERMENPVSLSNEDEIMENPISLLNEDEMMENPIGLSNDDEMIENPIILSNDNEMVVDNSEEIEESHRRFFGNNSCLSRNNESILDTSNNNDAVDSCLDSPDIFEDC